MRPRRPPRPISLTIREIAVDEEYVAYHVVETDDRDDDRFFESFKSRIARGLPPRTWTQEGANPELADGVSAYKTRDAAAETSAVRAPRDTPSHSSHRLTRLA